MAWMTPDPWMSLLEEAASDDEAACVNKRPKVEDTVKSDDEAACANKHPKVEATVTSDGWVRHEAVAARGYGEKMLLLPRPFWRVLQRTEVPQRYRLLDRFTDKQLATMPESLHVALVTAEEGLKKSWADSELMHIEMYKNAI